MTDKLKSCPFCGSAGEHIVFGKGQKNERHGVRCSDLTCGAMVRLGTKRGESAELWNTRNGDHDDR
jgi:Lar family restriction alleviation protein